MITVLDCAHGVKAIYKNLDFPGFQLIRGFYDPKNRAVGIEGYSVGLYKDSIDGDTYMLSIRGSAKGITTKDWVDDDVSIGLGQLPDRTNDSVTYVQAVTQLYPTAFIILVGHSLGGHIAQYLGVVFNLPFITFNAPPALGCFNGRLPDGTRVGAFDKGLNYRVNYDPVSKTFGKHVGPLVTLPLNGQKHASAHGAAAVVHSVGASGIGGNVAAMEIVRQNP